MPPRVRAIPRGRDRCCFSLMILVAVASVMVTLLGFAKTAFTVVLVAPVLVVAGFMHEFHQKFTFAEGFAFLFAVIAGVLPVSWFVWLPLGNAFLVQNTNFYKPSVMNLNFHLLMQTKSFLPWQSTVLVTDLPHSSERKALENPPKWNSFVPTFHEPFTFHGRMKPKRRFTKFCRQSCGQTALCFCMSLTCLGSSSSLS